MQPKAAVQKYNRTQIEGVLAYQIKSWDIMTDVTKRKDIKSWDRKDIERKDQASFWWSSRNTIYY